MILGFPILRDTERHKQKENRLMKDKKTEREGNDYKQ
jgi:hypothetical protein